MKTCQSGFNTANAKYKNIYIRNNYVAKSGDAIEETKGWHNSKKFTWLGNEYGILLRAYSDSIFSYYGGCYGASDNIDANYDKSWTTRACIVIGNEF